VTGRFRLAEEEATEGFRAAVRVPARRATGREEAVRRTGSARKTAGTKSRSPSTASPVRKLFAAMMLAGVAP